MLGIFKKPLGVIVDWWKVTLESEVILKEYRPSKDCECPTPSLPSSTECIDASENGSDTYLLPLNYVAIKTSLEELTKYCSHHFPISSELEWSAITIGNIKNFFYDASDLEVNVGFLWAAFWRRHDLFPHFLALGAQLSFCEHNYGLSVLHITAYIGCTEGVRFLLCQRDCYVNLMYKCYSPLHCAAFGDSVEIAAILLEKGSNIHAFTNDVYCYLEGVLHCAVRAKAVRCLKLFCKRGANVHQLDSSGKTSMHLAAELGHTDCLQILITTKGANIDYQTKEKQQTPLHFAAQKCHQNCVDVLLEHNASANLADYRHQTPLHLAAKSQSNECMKLLLQKGKANPNWPDINQRTPLHLTISQSSPTRCSEIIKTLIRYGADVNVKDAYGFTPLYLAADNELSECVEILIQENADITVKCKPGLTTFATICRKTPSSIDAIRMKLDECITFNDTSNKETMLQFDYSYIVRNCHPKEIQFLNTLLEEGHKELLLHPVCTSFLHLKWKKVRKFFVFRAICGFCLVLLMSMYVMMGVARHCYNFSKNITLTTYEKDKDLCINHSFSGQFTLEHPYIIEIQWYAMLTITLALIMRKLCAIPGYSSLVQYCFSMQNFLDWITVITVFLISFVYTGRMYIWQSHVSAFGVLLTWANFLYMLGQFPFFGTYIAMYWAVQQEFAKLLLVFSCLLIGFTVSFCVLFPSSEVFSNIYIGFITVLVMAVGEMDLDLITNPSTKDMAFNLNGSMQLVYILFITCVAIILLNLLVGIAVSDIQGLKRSAKMTKIIKTTELIACIDKALYTDYFHKMILNDVFRWSTLVTSNAAHTVYVQLHNRKTKILPLDILQDAYEVARKHRKKKKNFRKMCSQKLLFNNVKGQLKRNSNSAECLIFGSDLNGIKNEVRDLNSEIRDVRNLLESNQRLMEQLLRRIQAQDE
ncbi:hypothetical protein ABEB36_005154 [Hypothenemus hampei]|uniref:Ion transport domain-containing protein n=1 Tax=Hypothenemus hampei TaxID=57062 RepID=A0ABD1EXL7_HYPHA